MYVSARFRYLQRPSGKITRYLQYSRDVLRWRPAPAAPPGDDAITLPKATGPASVTIDPIARLADIRVEVLKTEENDGRHFGLEIFTPSEHWSGKWNLPQESKGYS